MESKSLEPQDNDPAHKEHTIRNFVRCAILLTALKAANPAFKIDTLNVNLEKLPGSGSYTVAPHWMLAHTVSPIRHFFAAPPSYAGEVVGVEFTMPPARAVAAKILRESPSRTISPWLRRI